MEGAQKQPCPACFIEKLNVLVNVSQMMNLNTVCNTQCSEQSTVLSWAKGPFSQILKEEAGATQVAVQHILGSTIQKNQSEIVSKNWPGHQRTPVRDPTPHPEASNAMYLLCRDALHHMLLHPLHHVLLFLPTHHVLHRDVIVHATLDLLVHSMQPFPVSDLQGHSNVILKQN